MSKIAGSHDELYHYTTAGGLSGILEDKSLWATHASFVNDEEEILGFYDRVLPKILRPIFWQYFEDIKDRPEFQKLQGNTPFELYRDDQFENLIRTLKEIVSGFHDHYITSFSTAPEDKPWLAAQGLAATTEKRGSLVGRGLAAVENNKKFALTKSRILNLRIWGAENCGDALDQLLLADDYRNGNGLNQDDKKSIYWYRKAAEQGDKHGQACLGIGYRDGRGIEQNDEQAVFWLRKAAEQGSEYGQVSLGCMYVNGLGVEQNDGQAVYWYRKAAEQGNHGAQEALRKLGIDWK